jgi:hypothetical protein
MLAAVLQANCAAEKAKELGVATAAGEEEEEGEQGWRRGRMDSAAQGSSEGGPYEREKENVSSALTCELSQI